MEHQTSPGASDMRALYAGSFMQTAHTHASHLGVAPQTAAEVLDSIQSASIHPTTSIVAVAAYHRQLLSGTVLKHAHVTGSASPAGGPKQLRGTFTHLQLVASTDALGPSGAKRLCLALQQLHVRGVAHL
jgi:hypothetical protein